MVAVRLTPPFPFVVVGSPRLSSAAAAGPSASTICAGTPACACAARTVRSRHGRLSTATAIEGGRLGPLIANDFPPCSARRSRAWDWRRCPRRSPPAPIKAGKLSRCWSRSRRPPGGFPLLSRPPPDAAEAARLHRSREGRAGHTRQGAQELEPLAPRFNPPRSAGRSRAGSVCRAAWPRRRGARRRSRSISAWVATVADQQGFERREPAVVVVAAVRGAPFLISAPGSPPIRAR